MYSVELSQLVDRFDLKNLTPEVDLDGKRVSHAEVNRPALQLTGFYEYFDSDRLQIIGQVEYSYMLTLQPDQRREVFKKLFSTNIPALVICRGLAFFEEDGSLECAVESGVPVFGTDMSTTSFMAEVMRYLNAELAPRISLHGVLVDIFGEGVLIIGESGIGKSETALELIKRGHRLVADDVVEIKKISDSELVGSGPEVIQYFIELRGIGILDVKELFGVESIKSSQSIYMVIKLEVWDPNKQYDRLGLQQETMTILGNKVICYSIPIRPGRNLAIIAETAAINHRQKKMGYNAAEELNNRVIRNINRRRQERKRNGLM